VVLASNYRETPASFAAAPRSDPVEQNILKHIHRVAPYAPVLWSPSLVYEPRDVAAEARVVTAVMIDTCVTCAEPLLLDIDSDDDDNDSGPESSSRNGRTVPDSVELNCGCHFHWSVLFSIFFTPRGG